MLGVYFLSFQIRIVLFAGAGIERDCRADPLEVSSKRTRTR